MDALRLHSFVEAVNGKDEDDPLESLEGADGGGEDVNDVVIGELIAQSTQAGQTTAGVSKWRPALLLAIREGP